MFALRRPLLMEINIIFSGIAATIRSFVIRSGVVLQADKAATTMIGNTGLMVMAIFIDRVRHECADYWFGKNSTFFRFQSN